MNINPRAKLNVPESKENYNRDHFDIAAIRYDLATRFLSLFQDSKWKKLLVESIPQFYEPRIVDLACGTGDILALLLQRYSDAHLIEGIDLSPKMLAIAKKRFKETKVKLTEGSILNLPYSDESVDIVTASYAIRNSPDPVKTLVEISRVLKPGGVFACLDFCKSQNKTRQKIDSNLLWIWGGLFGTVFHADPRIHSYIGLSLKNFLTQEEIIKKLKDRGVELLNRKPFFAGITEIITFKKT